MHIMGERKCLHCKEESGKVWVKSRFTAKKKALLQFMCLENTASRLIHITVCLEIDYIVFLEIA